MSRVTCHMSHVTIFFSFFFFFGQSGETYRWRVCYQRGLPRLVLSWRSIHNVLDVHNANNAHNINNGNNVCKFYNVHNVHNVNNVHIVHMV